MPPSLPELGAAGSYSAYERFTPDDVADVVEYGRARGVRIMIEIDTPGHAAAMCKAHPEICPSPTCTMPLNPATNATFDVLSTLFKDITGGARGKGLVPDNMMHLGGDEVWGREEAARQDNPVERAGPDAAPSHSHPCCLCACRHCRSTPTAGRPPRVWPHG